MLTDLEHPDADKGQIAKAVEPESWSKWGKHYLPTALSAHRRQERANFKDASGALFATPALDQVRLTNLVSKALTRFSSSSAASALRHDSRAQGRAAGASRPRPWPRSWTCGGCFTGDTLVRLLDGELVPVHLLRAGDLLSNGAEVGPRPTVVSTS